jgi:hypothetical protein
LATGLRLPVGVTPKGGAALVDREKHAEQLIFSALSDCSNENAFQQDIGFGAEAVFAVDDADLRARLLRKLRLIFAEFEGLDLYKLDEETILFTNDSATQDLILTFKYVNLETDESFVFNRVIESE